MYVNYALSNKSFTQSLYADETENTLIIFETKETIRESCYLRRKPESGSTKSCLPLPRPDVLRP